MREAAAVRPQRPTPCLARGRAAGARPLLRPLSESESGLDNMRGVIISVGTMEHPHALPLTFTDVRSETSKC